ncbi:DUF4167 domain-containing protein [Bradyrhizobium sp. 186]|uniref:DUF4167 domain-containing protein n=1 Tax=Bradyrhizobium sp. 186 TaxID=2782654 RepID=UPI00204F9E4F|nr:DUF4167 domain-containing protein [Bradyrhizobium sp. 186]
MRTLSQGGRAAARKQENGEQHETAKIPVPKDRTCSGSPAFLKIRRSYERYLALAHAEALNGDRIAAENYFQHAEHYFRSMHQN